MVGSNKVVKRLVAAIICLTLIICAVAGLAIKANLTANVAECKAVNDTKLLIGGLIDVAEENASRNIPGNPVDPSVQRLRDASRVAYEKFRARVDKRLELIDC